MEAFPSRFLHSAILRHAMDKCPLCGHRAAKRHCPAKAVRICPVCCGTKREIEIDCPSDCRYLRSGRAYESERGGSPAPFRDREKFNEQFFYRHAELISGFAGALLEQRGEMPHLVDEDARQALRALQATMKTLDAGIYYETLPGGGAGATAVYRRLKAFVDDRMQEPGGERPVVRPADVLAVVDFMMASAEFHSAGRPRSRRYLDWLQKMVPESSRGEPSRLIVP